MLLGARDAGCWTNLLFLARTMAHQTSNARMWKSAANALFARERFTKITMHFSMYVQMDRFITGATHQAATGRAQSTLETWNQA